jgi:hypothetical protein
MIPDKHTMANVLLFHRPVADRVRLVQYLPNVGSSGWKVLELLSDLDWHTTQEVDEVSQAVHNLRRMRELRNLPYLYLDKEKLTGAHLKWRYRLVPM